MDMIKCKVINWRERSKGRSDWKKSIKEAEMCIGLYCHLRRMRRRRRRRRTVGSTTA